MKRAKGDLDGATFDINKSIALDPNNAEAYCNLALVYLTKHDNEAAKKSFSKCDSIDASLRSRFETLAREIR